MAINLKKHGPYALITGASLGIGEEFANQLAQKGFNLILVARNQKKLDSISSRLSNAYKIDIKVIALDLMNENAVEELVAATDQLEIGLVVLNAGVYGFGAFLDNSLEYERNLIQLNVIAPMQLAHHFGHKMVHRQRGGILFLGSSAGFQAIPYNANYSASKAYVLLLGEALNYELKPLGVDVEVLAPGMTKTEGTDAMRGVDMSKMPGKPMQSTQVVAEALQQLGKSPVVVPGSLNRFVAHVGKYLMSRRAQTSLFAKMIIPALLKKP
jgi:short-subunit dehydrogenase